MTRALVLAAVVTLASLPTANAQSEGPAKTADTRKGAALVDTKGMTLYVFDQDTGGKSHCTADCARTWRPLLAPESATASGSWSVVSRAGGTKQWAYNGKPLYTYARDSRAGDVSGDGVGGVWHIARP